MSEDPDRVIKRLNKLLGVLKQSRDKGEERIAKLEADSDDYEKGILDTEGELKEYKESAKREERYGLRLKGELSQAKSDISKLTAAIGEAEANRRYVTEEARFEEVQLDAVYMVEDLGQKLCIRRLKTGENHLTLGVWTPGGSNWLGSPITVDGAKLLEALQALFG